MYRLFIWLFYPVFFIAALAVLLASPLWQWRWYDELPANKDVRLEPARPFLSPKDIKQGSAFDLLTKAAEMQAKIIKPDGFDAEAKQLNLVPWEDDAFPGILKLLNESREAMDLAQQASTVKDPQIPSYSSPSDSMPYLSPMMVIARLYRASAARLVEENDYSGAFSRLNKLIDVADVLSRNSPVLPRLVEMTMEANAFSAMRFIALQNDVPAPVALETIKHLIDVDNHMEPWAEVYRQESRCAQAIVKMFFDPSGRPILADMSSVEGEQYLRAGAHYFGWIFGSTPTNTTTHVLRVFAQLIDMAEKPYDVERLKEFYGWFSRPMNKNVWLVARDPFGYLIVNLTIPVFSGLNARHLGRLAELRTTEVVLAIRQYQQREHHLPVTLQDCVPAFLPSVPIDPFDNKPLRYVLKPDNQWIVYSVGANQKDDGGVPSEHPNEYNSQGDLVFLSNEVEEQRVKIAKSNTAKQPAAPLSTTATSANESAFNQEPAPTPSQNIFVQQYRKQIADAIGPHWYSYVHQKIDSINSGSVRLKFYVTKEGHVEDVKVLSSNASQELSTCSQKALTAATIPPVPPQVMSSLENGRLPVEYTFTIYPDTKNPPQTP